MRVDHGGSAASNGSRRARAGMLVALGLIVTGLCACAGVSKRSYATDTWLDGTLTYLERMALPGGAEATVQLINLSPSETVVAEFRRTTTGEQVPLKFELPYRRDAAERGGQFVLRARIAIDGRLRWTTPMDVPVTLGNPRSPPIEVMLSAYPSR